MKILAIGAHPDDIELGCGGLLLKAARQGHEVHMYSVTRGAVGGDPKQRTKELMQSAKFIGAKNLWIDNFEDTRLTVGNELISHIEFFVNKVDPELIITHSHGDVHHDHRAVSLSTVEAGRFVSNILSYEIPLTRNFEPQVFFDITDVIDDKVELIKKFSSQQSKLYLQADGIKGLAEYRALQSRLNSTVNHVEAFEVLKLCLDKEFKLLKVPHNLQKEQDTTNLNEILECV
ncbi:MAG TPA: PIG-L deacetylase family protein [Nitrosopumilaceae archaeon]|nr:PIG-L deacetylase family protein [Nitrosopumilaceae archaeon]